jgi:hypothetical protein
MVHFLLDCFLSNRFLHLLTQSSGYYLRYHWNRWIVILCDMYGIVEVLLQSFFELFDVVHILILLPLCGLFQILLFLFLQSWTNLEVFSALYRYWYAIPYESLSELLSLRRSYYVLIVNRNLTSICCYLQCSHSKRCLSYCDLSSSSCGS